MKRPLVLLWLIGFFGAAAGEVYSMTWPEQDAKCLEVTRNRKLPMKLKTRGKPKRARWEQVDRVLTATPWHLNSELLAVPRDVDASRDGMRT